MKPRSFHLLNLQSEEDEEECPSSPKQPRMETAMSFLLPEQLEEEKNGNEETEAFIREPELNPDGNSLLWWKNHAHKFPLIAHLAKRYLSVSATSVPSGRIFSIAGLTITNHRSSLKPENVDMPIFFNKNCHYIL